ncbi:hypothetical protein BGZ83_001791 [Gryganskiella cystojenkinii]|nr:hypothetical protein BGZ83_001791 [Gryganskiella cystojenkinii]
MANGSSPNDNASAQLAAEPVYTLADAVALLRIQGDRKNPFSMPALIRSTVSFTRLPLLLGDVELLQVEKAYGKQQANIQSQFAQVVKFLDYFTGRAAREPKELPFLKVI